MPAGRARRFAFECTQQAAGLLRGVGYGGERRALDKVAKAALGVDMPKDLQTSHWAAPRLSLGQVAYAGSDAVLARRIWTISKTRLHQLRRWNAYELQRDAIPGVAYMELRGAGFDLEEHRRQSSAWARDLAEARQEYFEITGKPPTTTPNEVRAWLQTVLSERELARWEPTATGLPTIKAKALRTLGHIASARPVLRILDKEKLISSFGPKLAARVNPVTRRLHSHFNLAATKAGRFSSTDPNFQQLPRDLRAAGFRACITAAPGHVLIGADYSQIELRALAHIAHNRALTLVYAEGRDLHRETAARITHKPYDDVTGDERQAAKPVNFGVVYGMRGPGLAAYAFESYGVEMTVREAEEAIRAFFDAYPGLKEHLDDHYEICQRRGYVVIGAGRVVMAAWEPERRLSFQQCCNLPVQGIAADAMLRVIAITYAELRRARIRGGMIATVHDEPLLEVLEDDAEEAREILEAAMIEAFTRTFPGAPTLGVVEAKIGRNWAEVKNPPKVSEDTRKAASA
jgi:DNA polymerase-1